MFLPQDIEEMCSIEKCPTGLHENQSQAGASTSTCSLPLMPVQTHDGASDGISRQDGQLNRSDQMIAKNHLAENVHDRELKARKKAGIGVRSTYLGTHGFTSCRDAQAGAFHDRELKARKPGAQGSQESWHWYPVDLLGHPWIYLDEMEALNRKCLHLKGVKSISPGLGAVSLSPSLLFHLCCFRSPWRS